MIRRNYESDLEIVLTQTEALGRAEKWSILFFTGHGDSPSHYVVATREGESYKNCRPAEGGSILCTFKNHGLSPGVLRCKVILETEDPDFAPALKRTVIPMDTPYRLGPWAGDDADLNISMLEIAGLLVPGPSGPKGERGEQGDPGAPGEQGAPGPGVARGGSTGQALVKGSDSDYDTRWAEVLRADQPQQLSRSQQAQARENISSVGYLCLEATLGTEADNWPLVLTTSLGEVQAAYTQFRAAPGRYRWSLAIHSRAGGNPFVEETELEPLHRDDGGLELQFTSKRSGMRYALVLTIADSTVTAATVEYLGNVGGEIVERIEGPEVVLDTVGGYIYECGELASLTLRTVEDSPREAVVTFRSGAVPTELVLPLSLGVVGYAVPQPGRAYEISVRNNIAVIVYSQQA